jgi:hypothetical protein
VLNTTDGEPGTILNGYTLDPACGWVEYEVVTPSSRRLTIPESASGFCRTGRSLKSSQHRATPGSPTTPPCEAFLSLVGLLLEAPPAAFRPTCKARLRV